MIQMRKCPWPGDWQNGEIAKRIGKQSVDKTIYVEMSTPWDISQSKDISFWRNISVHWNISVGWNQKISAGWNVSTGWNISAEWNISMRWNHDIRYRILNRLRTCSLFHYLYSRCRLDLEILGAHNLSISTMRGMIFGSCNV